MEISRDSERLSRILSLIPSASSLKEQKTVLREKRIRLRYDPGVMEGFARIRGDLAGSLGITGKLEIVAAGKAKIIANALISDDVEPDRVHVNPEEASRRGIADNSIVTVRAYREGLP
ncbi:MAG: hypothetical protein P3X22_006470 [Thermoprotei archaeon]|nr:hypothetical protein [Thermoprotei archaeon]